mgnify:CR=1 FL=1
MLADAHYINFQATVYQSETKNNDAVNMCSKIVNSSKLKELVISKPWISKSNSSSVVLHLESELSSNDYWCKRVQAYRQLVIDKKVRTIISPRATFNGEKLLAAGLSQEKVEEMVIFKGLTADERSLITL